MTRWIPLAALVLAAGCDVCPVNTIDTDKFASVSQFHDDIVACTNQRDCDQLCLDVFQLGPDDSLESCAITKLVPAGGVVHVRYTEAQTCGGDDGDTVIVTTGGDDGDGSPPPPDDGSCNDGSCDPPPSNPCSDGSCDPPPDNGGDDGTTDDGGGGDDGGDGGDDGAPRLKPTAPISRPAR